MSRHRRWSIGGRRGLRALRGAPDHVAARGLRPGSRFLEGIGAIIAAGYVVHSAPVLLADVLVDGAISAGLYRRLRRAQGHSWWEGAVTLRDAWHAIRTR